MRVSGQSRSRGFTSVFLVLILFGAAAALSGCGGSKAGSDPPDASPPDPMCGNGVLESGEECDNGPAGTGTCDMTCLWQDFSLEPNQTGSNTEAAVAVSSEGHFVVAYKKRDVNALDFDVFGVVYNRAGTLVWGPRRLNSIRDSDQEAPAVAVGPDGTFVAVWQSGPEIDRDVFVRWFPADTWEPAEPEKQVNQSTGGTQYAPAVAWLPGGRAVVTWTGYYDDGDGAGVLARMYEPDRQPAGDLFVVNTFWENDQQLPSVASSPDGRFVVAWESKCQESG